MLKKVHLIALWIGALTIASNIAAQSKKLPEILRFQTLGAQVAWLEKQIGPAKTISGQERTYSLGSCSLRVHLYPDNSIANLGLEKLSPVCTFNTEAIGLPGPAHLLRFKDLSERTQWSANVTCFFNCGNSADPTYFLYGEGPRTVQFLEYQAEIGSTAAGKADSAFFDEIMSKMSAQQRDDLRQNPLESMISQTTLNKLWLKHFGQQRVQSLYFGYRLSPN